MRKIFVLAATASLLAGCASGGETWAPNPGVASGTFPTAMAQCQKEASALPSNMVGASNPLYAAGMQEEFMVRCMAAAGWHRG